MNPVRARVPQRGGDSLKCTSTASMVVQEALETKIEKDEQGAEYT